MTGLPMPISQLSIDQFSSLVQPMVGMTVSLAWKGAGSTIFLELGELAPLEEGYRYRTGEACISLNWDWRVEEETRVCFGSSNNGPEIEEGLSALHGSKMNEISVTGEIRELVITFSSGHRLKSMTMVAGDPEWYIRLPDTSWIFSEDGLLVARDGEGKTTRLTRSAAAVFARAETTAGRWGTPSAEPKLGICRDCRSYVRIDGNGCLLDFGVCTEPSSPLDGRAVRCSSGCPAFTSR